MFHGKIIAPQPIFINQNWSSGTKNWYNIKKAETGKHFFFFIRL